ncbi:MAG: hypothetical protein NPIRA06_10500 [Nitrospirales bacterium]|nr:MAG: hypothetical protein NPIRA06_10500 [Nitrospirales bacterium]
MYNQGLEELGEIATIFGKWQVGGTRMLAAQTPFSLSMTNDVNFL